MAFDIVYVFKALDQFTKVAKKVEKSIEKIERKVKGVNKKLDTFQKKGKKSFTVVGNAAKRAGDSFEKFSRKQKKGNVAMRAFGAVVGNVKFRLASLAVTLGSAGLGMRTLIATGSETQKSLLNFSALTGIVGEDLDFLKEKAKTFSRVFGLSIDDIFLAFKRIAGLKPELIDDADALALLTKWALILDVPLEEINITSRALTVALNVYGKSAKSAAEFTNILAAASRIGSAEVDDIALSFLKAGQVAQTVAKVSFPDLIATIETLAKTGLLRQTSGTGLRTLLIRLQKAGFDFEKVGVAGIFEDINKQLTAITDPTRRAQLSFDLFGLRQQAVGLGLSQNVALFREVRRGLDDQTIAIQTATIALSAFDRKLSAIRSLLDTKFLAVLSKISDSLLEAQRQIQIFVEALDAISPEGIQGFLNILIGTFNLLLGIINDVILGIAVLSAPIRFILGDFGAFNRLAETTKNIVRLEQTPLPLESILTQEERAFSKGGAGSNGKARVDVNIQLNENGRFEVITESTSDDNVELNTGQNLAFIG